MTARRAHFGLLGRVERHCINALVGRAPLYVVPDHLTALGFAGALVAGAALIGCRFSAWCLPFVYLGLFANWLGNSFDGALARHRRIERHRIGFLIDRASDVLSFGAMILALGLSPYLTWDAALMLFVAYLIHAIYTLMRMVVDGVQIIGLGGVGATEGRILIGVWVGVAQAARIDLGSIPSGIFHLTCGALLVAWFAVFARRVAADIVRIGALEQPAASVRNPGEDGGPSFIHDGEARLRVATTHGGAARRA